jgi:hypothetical protein
LEAVLPGFRSHLRSGIELQVGDSRVIDLTLEVGEIAQTVEVQAEAVAVETRSSTLGSIVESARILELPLDGRNVEELIPLGGAAVIQTADSGKTGGGSPSIAVAGGAGWGTDWTLDGASNISLVSGSSLIMPFPDAMQEFKVETSGVSAQRGTPSAVAAVTKSGTNQLRGNLFWFGRNDLFNARYYFATSRSTLKRNQFGGTLGGPIVSNKLFFFAGYQGTILRSDPAASRARVPTPAVLAGDWTAFTSPACNAGRQINLRSPFVNNRIDPALYSKPAVFVVTPGPNKGTKALAFPISNDPCGEFTFSGSREQSHEGYAIGKIDYQVSDKHSLFGRVIFYRWGEKDPMELNTNLLQTTGTDIRVQDSYSIGSTYLISPQTINAFRLAGNRTYQPRRNVKPGELFTWCDAGVKVYCSPDVTRIYNTSATGGFTINDGKRHGFKYAGDTYSLNNDLSLVRGAHQIGLGGSVTYGKQYNFSNFASVGHFRFTGGVTGLGMADFMMGNLASFQTARPNPHYVNGTVAALYVADTWRATPKLTLNYGVRWDPYIPQWAAAIYNFDHDRFLQGIKSSAFKNAPSGFYYRGDPGFPSNGVNARWLQFAPRVGLAWDPQGDGRTSVRASYSLSYVYVPTNFRETYSGGPPWGNRIILTNPTGGLNDPWRDVPGGNIFPYELDQNAPFTAAGVFYSQPYDIKAPYSNSWNLTVQRQIGAQFILSASYIGNNVINAWANRPLNPAIYFPGVADANGRCFAQGYTLITTAGAKCSTLTNTDARRKFTFERPQDGQKLGFVTDADDGATQKYQGMLLSIERRSAQGLTVSANYTWSHCQGSRVNLYNVMNDHPDNGYNDPNNRAVDDGNCESDRRHLFNLTTVAETPQFSNTTLRTLATGWRFAGIYRRSAGAPLFIVAGTDRALNGLEGNYPKQRPNQVLENAYDDKSQRPGSRFLNPAAFQLAPEGELGTMGRNSLQGPGTWSFDVSVSRIFPFRESQRLEFRAEVYNVTNSFRALTPDANFSSGTFGVIRDSQEPRILQFALKYVF